MKKCDRRIKKECFLWSSACLKHDTGTNYTGIHAICMWIKEVCVMSHLQYEKTYEDIDSCVFSADMITSQGQAVSGRL